MANAAHISTEQQTIMKSDVHSMQQSHGCIATCLL